MIMFAALKKIPWWKIVRSLAIGVTGELLLRRKDTTQADAVKRLEDRQQGLEESLHLLAYQTKIVFWTALAALVIAVAALIVALL